MLEKHRQLFFGLRTVAFANQVLPSLVRLDAFRAWFQCVATCPVYFCGDMDWSGLAIPRCLAGHVISFLKAHHRFVDQEVIG